MKTINVNRNVTIYPFVKDKLYQSYGYQSHIDINNLGKKASMTHKAHKDSKWSTVQMILDKTQMQQYIDELQKMCDELIEGK